MLQTTGREGGGGGGGGRVSLRLPGAEHPERTMDISRTLLPLLNPLVGILNAGAVAKGKEGEKQTGRDKDPIHTWVIGPITHLMKTERLRFDKKKGR